MAKNIVAIVGRPNVGKSTFFNRLVGMRHAIVDDAPGVTRDRLYHDADWAGHDFLVVDTGGIVFDKNEHMTDQIYKQVEAAVEEADLIVFMVDGRAGLVGADQDVANVLRKCKKPVLLAVNKIDEPKDANNVLEFYQLGLGEPYGFSAKGGTGGVGDFLDKIVEHFPSRPKKDKKKKDKAKVKDLETEEFFDEIVEEEDNKEGVSEEISTGPISIAIVGKPNVGKSSMINLLCGKQRAIVADEPGTTRDAIDTHITFEGREINLIDTAGIRRKSKVDYGIEAFAVTRSLKAIDRADVVVLMLDVTQEITDQDKKIATKIIDAGKAAVIVLNKWDLIADKSSRLMNEYTDNLKRDLRSLSFAEIVFTSATTRLRGKQILEAAQTAWLAANKRVSTALLNQIIGEAAALTPPPVGKRGKRLRIYYSTQASVAPPTFILFVNDRQLITKTYEVYLERKLRESFGFGGTPIRLFLRSKKS